MKSIAAAFTLVTVGGVIAASSALAEYGPQPYTPPSSLSGAGNIRTPTANGRRVLQRNTTPILSSWTNLLFADSPGSIEQQYFNRTLPQEDLIRTQGQTRRAMRGLQREINQQQVQIQSGLNTTGRRTTFMNRGSYYGGR